MPEWARQYSKLRSYLEIDMDQPLGVGDFGVVYKAEIKNVGGVGDVPNQVTPLLGLKYF